MGFNVGYIRRNWVGTVWNGSTTCGTRSLQSNAFPSQVTNVVTIRGCSQEYYPVARLDITNYPCNLQGYEYQQNPTYWSAIDTEKRGECYGILRRCIISGAYNTNIISGTRSLMCDNFTTYPSGRVGIRGCKYN